jgi:hypothetical protein
VFVMPCFVLFLKHNTSPDQQAISTPKSSRVADGVCDALFCFVFEAQHQTRPASHQAIGTPKSSTVADGQPGFHLHTSGYEPLLTDYWFLDPHTDAEPANTSCKLSAEPHNP